MDNLEEGAYFITPIYMISKPEFLERVKKVSDKYLDASRPNNRDALTIMTGNYSNEEEIADFAQYVSQTAWNILNAQGYGMDNLVTYFMEMWTQEHHKGSDMDYHIHGYGSQISAFYFLDAPEGGCQMIIHDPRPTKVASELPPKDMNALSFSSQRIVFTPTAGTLILTNSWLPHSFSRNVADEPVRFVHMNLAVAVNPTPAQPEVEII